MFFFRVLEDLLLKRFVINLAQIVCEFLLPSVFKSLLMENLLELSGPVNKSSKKTSFHFQFIEKIIRYF